MPPAAESNGRRYLKLPLSGPDLMRQTAGRTAPRLLLIDNYDSFTYNLVQAFLVLGADVRVHRNDEITVEAARDDPSRRTCAFHRVPARRRRRAFRRT